MAYTIKAIAAGDVSDDADWQELPGTAAPNKNATVSATADHTILLASLMATMLTLMAFLMVILGILLASMKALLTVWPLLYILWVF
jgi:hypothetical protein